MTTIIKRKPILKALSLALVVSFLASDISYAAPGMDAITSLHVSPIDAMRQDLSRFEAPLDFSSLQELHPGQNGKPIIIHIQDAHSNYSGQQNLAGALDFLIHKYGVTKILAEGSWIDSTLTPLREAMPVEDCKRISKSLLMDGQIAGEEYLNLTSQSPMQILGIEDKELYFKSLRSYAALAEKREAIFDYLHQIEASLDKLKRKHYPKNLLQYEKKDSTDRLSHVDQLLDLMANEKISLENFPNLQKLDALKVKEKQIDFTQANLEQARIIEELSKRSSKTDFSQQLQEMRLSKKNKASMFSFFQNILNMAKEKNLSLGQYPNLLLYGNYLKEYSALEMDKLLDEIQKAEDEVYLKALSPNKDALLIRSIDRYLNLLDTAYHIHMTSKEFKIFQINEPDFSTISYLAFINRKLAEDGYYQDLISLKNILEEGRKALGDFYDSVNERDEAFLRNTKRILGEKKEKAIVLISGGYHTQHLKQLFQEEGYGYVVLSPIVTQETNQAKYEKLLLSPLHKELKKVEVTQDKTTSKPLSDLEADLKFSKREKDGLVALLLAARLANGNDAISEFFGNDPPVRNAIEAISNRVTNGARLSASESPVSVIPKDAKDLVLQLKEAYDNNPDPVDDVILEHALHAYFDVSFYAVKTDKQLAAAEEMHRRAFGKVGPILATQKDGVVLPFIGKFYKLVEAHQDEATGRKNLVIQEMSDTEVLAKYGLRRIMGPDKKPLTMKWHSLKNVIGRLSILPGRFGMVELHHGSSEMPANGPADLLKAVFLGDEVVYRDTRLEVKAAGAQAIKSINRVFKTENGITDTKQAIFLMPERSGPAPADVDFVLKNEMGEIQQGVTFENFLNLPGVFTDGAYQAGFVSSPGSESADQSEQVMQLQDGVRAVVGSQSPDYLIANPKYGDGAASIRMTLNEPGSARMVEILREYDEALKSRNPEASALGRLKKSGQISEMLRQTIYWIARNNRLMSLSNLYLYPNGEPHKTEQRALHASHWDQILGEVQTGARPAANIEQLMTYFFRDFLNNTTFGEQAGAFGTSGRAADLAEYIPNAPATPEFQAEMTLLMISQLTELLIEKGLITEDEAKSPELFKAYLQGAALKNKNEINDRGNFGGSYSIPKSRDFKIKPNVITTKTEIVTHDDGSGQNYREESVTTPLDNPITVYSIEVASPDGPGVIEQIKNVLSDNPKPTPADNFRKLIYHSSVMGDQGEVPNPYYGSLGKFLEDYKTNSVQSGISVGVKNLVPQSLATQIFIDTYQEFAKWKKGGSVVSIQDETEKLIEILLNQASRYDLSGVPQIKELIDLFIAIQKALLNHDYYIHQAGNEPEELRGALGRLNELVAEVRSPEFCEKNPVVKPQDGEVSILGNPPVASLVPAPALAPARIDPKKEKIDGIIGALNRREAAALADYFSLSLQDQTLGNVGLNPAGNRLLQAHNFIKSELADKTSAKIKLWARVVGFFAAQKKAAQAEQLQKLLKGSQKVFFSTENLSDFLHVVLGEAKVDFTDSVVVTTDSYVVVAKPGIVPTIQVILVSTDKEKDSVITLLNSAPTTLQLLNRKKTSELIMTYEEYIKTPSGSGARLAYIPQPMHSLFNSFGILTLMKDPKKFIETRRENNLFAQKNLVFFNYFSKREFNKGSNLRRKERLDKLLIAYVDKKFDVVSIPNEELEAYIDGVVVDQDRFNLAIKELLSEKGNLNFQQLTWLFNRYKKFGALGRVIQIYRMSNNKEFKSSRARTQDYTLALNRTGQAAEAIRVASDTIENSEEAGLRGRALEEDYVNAGTAYKNLYANALDILSFIERIEKGENLDIKGREEFSRLLLAYNQLFPKNREPFEHKETLSENPDAFMSKAFLSGKVSASSYAKKIKSNIEANSKEALDRSYKAYCEAYKKGKSYYSGINVYRSLLYQGRLEDAEKIKPLVFESAQMVDASRSFWVAATLLELDLSRDNLEHTLPHVLRQVSEEGQVLSLLEHFRRLKKLGVLPAAQAENLDAVIATLEVALKSFESEDPEKALPDLLAKSKIEIGEKDIAQIMGDFMRLSQKDWRSVIEKVTYRLGPTHRRGALTGNNLRFGGAVPDMYENPLDEEIIRAIINHRPRVGDFDPDLGPRGAIRQEKDGAVGRSLADGSRDNFEIKAWIDKYNAWLFRFQNPETGERPLESLKSFEHGDFDRSVAQLHKFMGMKDVKAGASNLIIYVIVGLGDCRFGNFSPTAMFEVFQNMKIENMIGNAFEAFLDEREGDYHKALEQLNNFEKDQRIRTANMDVQVFVPLKLGSGGMYDFELHEVNGKFYPIIDHSLKNRTNVADPDLQSMTHGENHNLTVVKRLNSDGELSSFEIHDFWYHEWYRLGKYVFKDEDLRRFFEGREYDETGKLVKQGKFNLRSIGTAWDPEKGALVDFDAIFMPAVYSTPHEEAPGRFDPGQLYFGGQLLDDLDLKSAINLLFNDQTRKQFKKEFIDAVRDSLVPGDDMHLLYDDTNQILFRLSDGKEEALFSINKTTGLGKVQDGEGTRSFSFEKEGYSYKNLKLTLDNKGVHVANHGEELIKVTQTNPKVFNVAFENVADAPPSFSETKSVKVSLGGKVFVISRAQRPDGSTVNEFSWPYTVVVTDLDGKVVQQPVYVNDRGGVFLADRTPGHGVGFTFPDPSVSRKHLSIKFNGDSVAISEDSGVSNKGRIIYVPSAARLATSASGESDLWWVGSKDLVNPTTKELNIPLLEKYIQEAGQKGLDAYIQGAQPEQLRRISKDYMGTWLVGGVRYLGKERDDLDVGIAVLRRDNNVVDRDDPGADGEKHRLEEVAILNQAIQIVSDNFKIGLINSIKADQNVESVELVVRPDKKNIYELIVKLKNNITKTLNLNLTVQPFESPHEIEDDLLRTMQEKYNKEGLVKRAQVCVHLAYYASYRDPVKYPPALHHHMRDFFLEQVKTDEDAQRFFEKFRIEAEELYKKRFDIIYGGLRKALKENAWDWLEKARANTPSQPSSLTPPAARLAWTGRQTAQKGAVSSREAFEKALELLEMAPLQLEKSRARDVIAQNQESAILTEALSKSENVFDALDSVRRELDSVRNDSSEALRPLVAKLNEAELSAEKLTKLIKSWVRKSSLRYVFWASLKRLLANTFSRVVRDYSGDIVLGAGHPNFLRQFFAFFWDLFRHLFYGSSSAFIRNDNGEIVFGSDASVDFKNFYDEVKTAMGQIDLTRRCVEARITQLDTLKRRAEVNLGDKGPTLDVYTLGPAIASLDSPITWAPNSSVQGQSIKAGRKKPGLRDRVEVVWNELRQVDENFRRFLSYFNISLKDLDRLDEDGYRDVIDDLWGRSDGEVVYTALKDARAVQIDLANAYKEILVSDEAFTPQHILILQKRTTQLVRSTRKLNRYLKKWKGGLAGYCMRAQDALFGTSDTEEFSRAFGALRNMVWRSESANRFLTSEFLTETSEDDQHIISLTYIFPPALLVLILLMLFNFPAKPPTFIVLVCLPFIVLIYRVFTSWISYKIRLSSHLENVASLRRANEREEEGRRHFGVWNQLASKRTLPDDLHPALKLEITRCLLEFRRQHQKNDKNTWYDKFDFVDVAEMLTAVMSEIEARGTAMTNQEISSFVTATLDVMEAYKHSQYTTDKSRAHLRWLAILFASKAMTQEQKKGVIGFIRVIGPVHDVWTAKMLGLRNIDRVLSPGQLSVPVKQIVESSLNGLSWRWVVDGGALAKLLSDYVDNPSGILIYADEEVGVLRGMLHKDKFYQPRIDIDYPVFVENLKKFLHIFADFDPSLKQSLGLNLSPDQRLTIIEMVKSWLVQGPGARLAALKYNEEEMLKEPEPLEIMMRQPEYQHKNFREVARGLERWSGIPFQILLPIVFEDMHLEPDTNKYRNDFLKGMPHDAWPLFQAIFTFSDKAYSNPGFFGRSRSSADEAKRFLWKLGMKYADIQDDSRYIKDRSPKPHPAFPFSEAPYHWSPESGASVIDVLIGGMCLPYLKNIRQWLGGGHYVVVDRSEMMKAAILHEASKQGVSDLVEVVGGDANKLDKYLKRKKDKYWFRLWNVDAYVAGGLSESANQSIVNHAHAISIEYPSPRIEKGEKIPVPPSFYNFSGLTERKSWQNPEGGRADVGSYSERFNRVIFVSPGLVNGGRIGARLASSSIAPASSSIAFSAGIARNINKLLRSGAGVKDVIAAMDLKIISDRESLDKQLKRFPELSKNSYADVLIKAMEVGIIPNKKILYLYMRRLDIGFYHSVVMRAMELGIISNSSDLRFYLEKIRKNKGWYYYAEVVQKAIELKIFNSKTSLKRPLQVIKSRGYYLDYLKIVKKAKDSRISLPPDLVEKWLDKSVNRRWYSIGRGPVLWPEYSDFLGKAIEFGLVSKVTLDKHLQGLKLAGQVDHYADVFF